MSAISGIFRIDDQDVDPKLINNMNNILSHRGPDGSGIWFDGPIALGHQMSHTTPESLLEKLPFMDETSGMVITADARIDNRDELSTLLNLKNSYEVPDSLFILKAYQKWGEYCPQKLLGDFAFAIWDPLRQQLFCARDHMGVKPFYYYSTEKTFIFATEIKALLTLPKVSRKLNELKLAFFLKIMVVDKKLTFYEDIIRLPPAHSLKIDHGGCEIKKYWELDPDLKIKLDSSEDYINAFHEIFAEAINCRMRSAFPIGFEMSGGLDSSFVAGMAKKILDENDSDSSQINTFSIVSDDVPEVNDRYFIEKFVDMGGVNPTFIHGDKISPFEELETALYYQDQPFFTPYMSVYRSMYNKMHEKNIRVLLNGEGGDHISAIGSNYFKELFLSLRWKMLMREINGLSKRINQNSFKIFITKVIFPLIPRPILRIYYNVFKTEKKKNIKDCILNKNFSNKLGGEKYLSQIIRGPIEAADTTRKYHHLALTGMEVDTICETRDMMCAEFHIDTRSPYRDKRLVEFCYGVPNEMKFKFGWNRYLHRVAMTDIVPKKIQWRPSKGEAGSSLAQINILSFGQNYLDEIINNTKLADYIDLKFIKKIYQEYKSGTDYTLFIWCVIILYYWFNGNDFLD